eukprot:TRINITY_DN46400_c0_g1_i1.p1 TRINITY_DN46400_c0_g1~~TRINITY_DN46400_c0_g1_i1.p1  ORF type:complete len:320 (+),score=50.64 TRINITY_DN46400_c0_g1_i1:60-1019(+)
MDTLDLQTLTHGDRIVAFGVVGPACGEPVLVWYPAGGSRRMLGYLYSSLSCEAKSHIRLICVNRPGKGGTSPVLAETATSNAKDLGVVTAVCADVVAVLDALEVRAVSLFFMCAGAPFALSFACRHPERVSGQHVGVAPWVLPRDSSEVNTMARVGTWFPSWIIAPVVGKMMSSGSSITSLPTSVTAGMVRSSFSKDEIPLFDKVFSSTEAFVGLLADIQLEDGGESEDIQVCLSGSEALGIDYGAVAGTVVLCHGEKDGTVTMASVEWLAAQLTSAKLCRLASGSHSGALFMLHHGVSDAVAALCAERCPVMELSGGE